MMLSLTILAQNNYYPVLIKEDGKEIVKLTKKQADDLKNKIKINNKDIKSLITDTIILNKRLDSLERELVKIKKEYEIKLKKYRLYLDTVDKFKKNIFALCSKKDIGVSGVIIYRKNFIDSNLYLIDLSNYNMKMSSVYNWLPYQSRNKITLIPVRKNRRWKVDVPQPQNLGLHMYPHDGINDNNKKLNW